MSITLYSFLMTVLASNIIMLLLYLCCRSSRIVVTVGLNPLLICGALCMLRISIPIEFSFAKEVAIPTLYNPIYELLSTEIIGRGITVLHLAVFIWIAVSIILLCRLLIAYYGHRRMLSQLPGMSTLQVLEIKRKIMTEEDQKRIRIVAIAANDIPNTLGVMKPLILLPLRNYGNKELELILMHEYTHFKSRDVLIKWVVEILCIVFWWCPSLYLFKYGLSSILEIRCDLIVMKGKNESSVRYYLKTIAKIAEIGLGIRSKRRSYIASDLIGDHELLQRVRVLLRYRKRKYKMSLAITSVLLAVVLYLTSYLYVFQSYYAPPTTDADGNSNILDSGRHMKDNGDGTFTMIVDGSEKIVSLEEMLDIGSEILNE